MSMSENEISDADSWFDIRFKKRFAEEIKAGGYIKSWIAIIDSYNGTTLTASVHLPNDVANIMLNIKNKSGESLATNDIVELHSRSSSLGSCYIGVKY